MKKKLGEYLATLQGQAASSQEARPAAPEEGDTDAAEGVTILDNTIEPGCHVGDLQEPGTSFIGTVEETDTFPLQDALRSLVEYVRGHQPEPDSKDHPSPRNRFTREGYALALYRLEEWIRSH